ncbi:MAG: sulfatase-like hydrolase/transferase [Phaeodactylibacter sp.]|uniref:sulfatase-like hydrolase/transferase n=1 Tax=Phaeodactylibacter sp. TaxID=1940289 RepID=UPI0032EEEB32
MMICVRMISLCLLIGLTGTPLFAQEASPAERLGFQPNILWISTEDIGCMLAAYGDSTAYTPNIDRLANEGVVYENAFTVAGVCAPSRSSMITGVYPTSMGTQHMRTWGIGVPPEIRPFTTYLRESGYYCTNQHKEDFNFKKPTGTWDESSQTAHWRNRAPGQPFFTVFNNIVTHEHKTWYNERNFLGVDIDDVPVPGYYPQDNEEVRKSIARVYSNIMDLDAHVGYIFRQLESANLLDSTIIVFWSDHGGPLPRQKRELYDSGVKVPFIIRYPDGYGAGSRTDELISLIDLGPSMLSLVGVDVPGHMHGRPFLGGQKAPERDYVYLHRDRMDGQYDLVRGVRDKRYKYFRNYHPERPNIQDIRYRLQVPMMQSLIDLHEAGELEPEQEIWFHTSKPVEELYDTASDPDELNNLAADPAYQDKLRELRLAHESWRAATLDLGAIPEPELHAIQEREGMALYDWARANPELVRRSWEAALLNVPGTDAKAVLKAARDPFPAVRYWGLYAMSRVLQDASLGEHYNFVSEQLEHPSVAVQVAAARTLGRHGYLQQALNHLESLMEQVGKDSSTHLFVAYTLNELNQLRE